MITTLITGTNNPNRSDSGSVSWSLSLSWSSSRSESLARFSSLDWSRDMSLIANKAFSK